MWAVTFLFSIFSFFKNNFLFFSFAISFVPRFQLWPRLAAAVVTVCEQPEVKGPEVEEEATFGEAEDQGLSFKHLLGKKRG